MNRYVKNGLVILLLIASHFIALFFLMKYYYFPEFMPKDFFALDFKSFYIDLFSYKFESYFTLYTLVSIVIPILAIWHIIFGVRTYTDYGNARFAKEADIRKMDLLADNGIILGKFNNKLIRTDKPLGILVFAPPGTGKTTAIAIPNLLVSNNSFFTLDVKGELYDLTRKAREKKGSTVFLFDPLSPESSKFNPLDKSIMKDYSWDQKVQLINQISRLIYQSENEKDGYWTEQGRQTFVTIGLYLLAVNNHASIPAIRAFALSDMEKNIIEVILQNDKLTQEQQQERVINLDLDEASYPFKIWLREAAKLEHLPLRVLEGMRSLKDKPDNEFGSVISTFLSPLEVFSQEQIIKNLSENDFDIFQFRKKTCDCYIRINEADMEVLKPIMRIFLDFNIKRLLTVLPTKEDKTITLMLDEFPRFGKLDLIMELPALSRAYKIPPIFICQSFGQIKEIYKEKSETIESITPYKVVFPQTEHLTAKKFSDLVGNYTRKKISKSGKSFESKSYSENYEGVKLISEQDILSLDDNTVFILTMNHYNTPIKATPYKYFKDPHLLKLIEKS